MPKPFRIFSVFRGSKPTPHRSLVIFALLVFFVVNVFAGGFSKTYSLNTGEVIVANNQKRSCWVPSTLLFHFPEPVDVTVSIKRRSKGHEYLLSKITFTSTQDMIWVPEADYPFNFGDALIVTTTATSGTLEIIQRSDS